MRFRKSADKGNTAPRRPQKPLTSTLRPCGGIRYSDTSTARGGSVTGDPYISGRRLLGIGGLCIRIRFARMSKRESYIFYRSWWQNFRNMPDELRLELYDKTMEYAFEAETSEMSVIADGIIGLIKPILDKDRAKYESICERNKINGSKGGRHKTQEKPKENPENPLGSVGSVWEAQKEPNENPEKPLNDIMINDKLNNNIESKDSLSVDTGSEDKINYMEIVTFYNNSVRNRNITQCIKLTEKRKQAIKARVIEFGRERVFEAITKAAESSFCNGANDRNWKADFDFVFNSNKMANILEGKYDDKNGRYGNNGNSYEQSARQVGEKVLGDIFAEIEGRERVEGVAD